MYCCYGNLSYEKDDQWSGVSDTIILLKSRTVTKELQTVAKLLNSPYTVEDASVRPNLKQIILRGDVMEIRFLGF